MRGRPSRARLRERIRGRPHRAALDEKRAALSREIRLLKTDPAYVEKVIRQRLNYVRKNEILYLFDKSREDSWSGADSDGKQD